MDFDLEPQNWKSERAKPKEPIFGPGLPGALAWVISFAVAVAIRYYFVGY
jgi:hypothetical protein